MLIAPLLLLAANNPPPPPATCKPFEVPTTPQQRSLSASLITRYYGHKGDPNTIDTILAAPGWRIVWGYAPDIMAMKVFFFRNDNDRWAYKGGWQSVGDQRIKYLRFARKLQVPERLAQCFADVQGQQDTVD